MQEQAGRPWLLIQAITTEWTDQTDDENGAAMRSQVPESLDLLRDLPGLPNYEQERTVDILYHQVLYDELNQ